MRPSRCAELEPLHSAWVDDELSEGERARLAAHLQRCARCRSAITQLRITQNLLRSMPVRRLPAALAPPGTTPARPGPRRAPLRRVAARSSAGLVAMTLALGVAAFAAGGQPPPAPTAPVPVDVYVADHLVRAVGGPASTPALLHAQP